MRIFQLVFYQLRVHSLRILEKSELREQVEQYHNNEYDSNDLRIESIMCPISVREELFESFIPS
jgi:hypothetical protein